MNLLSYIADMEQRRALAAKCSTNPDYLWQVANGWRGRKAGIDLCKRIEQATDGQVTRYDLRPDVFGQPPHTVERAGERSDAA